jgi:ABC-type transport system substrate-binding protein
MSKCLAGSAGKSALVRGCLLAVAAALVALAALAPPPVRAADPNKVLRVSFNAAETGFDPVRVSDNYSNIVNGAIFETLLTYDYLARPAKLVPGVAEAMPEVTEEGRTYTIRLRKGVMFTPDPAFKGKPRELTADDYIYTFKRFVDPKNRSPWAFLFEGHIEGLDEYIEAARKNNKFDYEGKVAGLQAIDRYTLRIRLKQPNFVFLYTLAHTPVGGMAREVVEAYGDELMAHPVGTGPYLLKEWKRGSKIVLEANPGFRGFVWDFKPEPGSAFDEALVAVMKGKKMPQIGRVEISVIEEEQSRWLAFSNQELDYVNVPGTFRSQVFDAERKLLPVWEQKGVTMFNQIEPDIVYTFFNFRDPVVGGFTKEKIALRRAIIMGYDLAEEIRVIRRGQAVRAIMPIPVGVVGHDPNWKPLNNYDPALANKLLDYYNYKKGPDGYRRMPDGKPLVLKYATGTSSFDRESNELWRKSMDAIGIRIEFQPGKFADHLKAAKACQLMMWGASWLADYPDGENFMQLLYGPNTHQSNNGCYESRDFDEFYKKMMRLPDSPARNRLFLEMTRQMEVDGAWVFGTSRERNQLVWPWVKGYKKHPIMHSDFIFLDIDGKPRA